MTRPSPWFVVLLLLTRSTGAAGRMTSAGDAEGVPDSPLPLCPRPHPPSGAVDVTMNVDAHLTPPAERPLLLAFSPGPAPLPAAPPPPDAALALGLAYDYFTRGLRAIGSFVDVRRAVLLLLGAPTSPPVPPPVIQPGQAPAETRAALRSHYRRAQLLVGPERLLRRGGAFRRRR